jgi:hypothetical protein
MVLRLLKGRGMVSGLFEKKRDAILPHPTPPQALVIAVTVNAKYRFRATACFCFTLI